MNVQINNLSVSVFEKKVLDKLDLNIKPGEMHVIMGPNGVGKSTLAKVIMGDTNYNVLAGDIIIDNKSILNLKTDERARMGIFLSFQDPKEIEGVTNSEFLREAVNCTSSSKVSLYDFIKEIEKDIQELDLDKELIHRSINQNFSGGEKKKNEILQLKMLKPKFIILDELDSGLDVDSLKIVCKNINNYLKENPLTSVLVITHYLKLFSMLKPNYVHILVDGKIVKTGDSSLASIIDKEGYKKYSTSSVRETKAHE